ncbi:MAG TPA: hypothetical protein DCZ94_17625 [Lentisphaeria bacterium]|nr:hypothetical protein [Lentisphaeria bacterium]
MLAHGFTRFTRDIDIWLDPTEGTKSWTDALASSLSLFKDAKVISIRSKKKINFKKIRKIVEKEEMIRIAGLDMDIDVFFRPNNLGIEDFEQVWKRSSRKKNKLRIPDEIDLCLTKMGTERIQDKIDMEWLDAKIIPVLSKKLKSCSLDDAGKIFSRITSIPLLKASMKNPNPRIRSLATMIQKKIKK